MILLIDGYNLLKNMITISQVSDQERKKFLEMLGLYAKRKHHNLIIVFDGGPYEWPRKERFMDMQVIYSGTKQSADELIMHYMDDHKTKEIILISSDHEINLFASQLDIPSLGSSEFGVLLKESRVYTDRQPETPLISYKKENHDLDIIMQEGSRHIPVKDEDRKHTIKHDQSSHRVSKSDKKLLLILRKL
jgi:Predicted RNA-binding protein containing a PIN domain